MLIKSRYSDVQVSPKAHIFSKDVNDSLAHVCDILFQIEISTTVLYRTFCI